MSKKISFSKIYNTLTSNANYSGVDIPSDFTLRPIRNSSKDIINFQIIFNNLEEGKLHLKSCLISVNENKEDKSNFSNRWKSLINDKDLKSAPSTLAEVLLAERMRMLKQGVTFYDLHPESNNLLFINDGLMYTCYLEENDEIKSMHMLDISNATNIKRNPVNWKLVSYIKDKNVFIIDILNNEPKQLTFSGTDMGSGSTHYVIQEEFDRLDGMWWRPHEDNVNEYHLLIEEYDESNVNKLIIPCYTFEFENEEYRYPQPGQTNAQSNLKILKIKTNSDNKSAFQCEILELPKHLFQLFPNYEYLTNAGWTPDGKFIWIQLADRLQNCLSTYLLSLNSFVSVSSRKTGQSNGYAVLFNKEQNEKYWVPVNMNTIFLKPCQSTEKSVSSNANVCSAIIGQTADGFNHLYLFEKFWTVPSTAEPFSIIVPEVSKNLRLTSGEWEVDIHKIWINEKDAIVYFLGNKDDILANHLYRVNYGNKEYQTKNYFQICEVTKADTVAYLNPESDWGVITTSSLGSSVEVKLINIRYSNMPEYTIFEIRNPFNIIFNGLLCENHPKLLKYNIVDDFGSNITLYGLLFLPACTEVKKWPTLHYIYGGPSVRLVENNYNRNFLYFAQKINHFGFAILVCDGRGSSKRGLIFEGHIKKKLGTVELNDQIYFLKNAATDTGLIDINRVGIYGSSYGGYLTLMAMFNHSDVYKCGMSCSPVVDFKFYDTAYTERYLGIPKANEDLYLKASVLHYISNFPKDRCRLIVAHGGKDENVHFLHTANLLRHSNKMGLDIKFLFYPDSRHGLKDRVHLESHLIKLLYKHLSP